MKDYRTQLFLSVFILLALLTEVCATSVSGEAASIPNPSVLDKVVDAQPYLWFLRERINEIITCESGNQRYIYKDEDELPDRVHVYYHVVEYKDRIYVLYVYHWQYSMFFSVYVPGLGRIEVGNHCWDYEPVIVVLDKDWTSLYAVYDAGHYDTEKVMAARSDTIDLQVVKGTHCYAHVDMPHSNCHTFPKNRFIPLTIDKIFDWQKQLQSLPPYGPHDLSLLDVYLFPWAVGPDSGQIDAFSHEISAYTWNDLYAVGGARLLVRQVYPYAQCVLDEINSIEVHVLKDAFNTVLENVGLVSGAEEAVNTHGVGPANVLTRDPKCAPIVRAIAFRSDRDGNWEVYVMNADGSGQTRLTNNPADDSQPAWSPDGKRIAFHSDRDGNVEVYGMNPDGSGQTRLTNNLANDDYPAWSPDSKRIAFMSDRDGNWEVYVMNADGSGQTRLTNNLAMDNCPAWSPDSKRIAFMSDRDGNWEVYVMNADGSSQTRLTNNPAMDRGPAWSPDRKRIAFHSNRDGNWEVYVMNADGSGQTRLTNNLADDGYPAWSPDGKRIAFHSNRDGNWEVYVMNADGSGQTRLTNNLADDGQPVWSP